MWYVLPVHSHKCSSSHLYIITYIYDGCTLHNSVTEYYNDLIQNVVLIFKMSWLIESAMSLFSFSVLLFLYLPGHIHLHKF